MNDPLFGVSNAGPWENPNVMVPSSGQLDAQGMPMGDMAKYGQANLGTVPLATKYGWDQNSWSSMFNPQYNSFQASQTGNVDYGQYNRDMMSAATDYLKNQGLDVRAATQGSNIFTGLFNQSGSLIDYSKVDAGGEANKDWWKSMSLMAPMFGGVAAGATSGAFSGGAATGGMSAGGGAGMADWFSAGSGGMGDVGIGTGGTMAGATGDASIAEMYGSQGLNAAPAGGFSQAADAVNPSWWQTASNLANDIGQIGSVYKAISGGPSGASVQNSADPYAPYRGAAGASYNNYLSQGNTVDPTQMPGYSQWMSGVLNPALGAVQGRMGAAGLSMSGSEQTGLMKTAQQGYYGFMTDYMNRLAQASGATNNPYSGAALGAQQTASNQQGFMQGIGGLAGAVKGIGDIASTVGGWFGF